MNELNVTLFAWETVAMLLGFAYIILAAHHNRWCWVADFFCAMIYIVLLWQDQLPIQSLLHSFYAVTAIYGWHLWRKKAQKGHLSVINMPLKEHFLFLGVGVFLTLFLAWMLMTWQWSQSPWLDAGIGVFSMLNTWLLLHHRLQSWLYWIVIDTLAILLYVQTDHLPTAMLSFVYMILAIYGYRRWRSVPISATPKI